MESLSLEELIALKGKVSGEDAVRLRRISEGKLADFADGKVTVSPSVAPLFLAFIDAFGKNGEKRTPAGQKAYDKLIEDLDAFDRQNGLAEAVGISTSRLLSNVAALDRLSALNPFEMTETDGRSTLKRPEFHKVFKVMKALRVTEDDGSESDASADRDLRTTLTEAAKLRAYLRLCVSPEEVTEELYCRNLEEILELNIVNLLIIDKIVSEYPLDKTDRDRLTAEFEKLLQTVSEL